MSISGTNEAAGDRPADAVRHGDPARERGLFARLRPRREIRRGGIVVIALALGAAIVAEAVWLVRHIP